MYYKLLFNRFVLGEDVTDEQKQGVYDVLKKDDNDYYKFWSYQLLGDELEQDFVDGLTKRGEQVFKDTDIVQQLRYLDVLIELGQEKNRIEHDLQKIENQLVNEKDVFSNTYIFYLYHMIKSKWTGSVSYDEEVLQQGFQYKNIAGQDFLLNSHFILDITGCYWFYNMQALLHDSQAHHTVNMNLR
ncbi:hypothetical protein PPOP_1984 [Paenibacillus popilliae ATCC 14706]|uniref:Uncharacterized protein n=1 Tax=Paenibacillus popilliae ATCC 14706 TaxID=1212764 RepID=M9LAG1_PAEPP|nr:hypothetical protein PPOP_1984 [Paenibacillus popilliae ATCC 14706]